MRLRILAQLGHLLFCVAAAAQGTADTVYHLHGSVVNGVTGRPIGRALVVSGDRRLATMTDAEGQFTMEVSVPPAAAAGQGAGRGTQLGGASGSGFTDGSSTFQVFPPGLSLSAQRPGYLQSHQGVSVLLDSTTSTRNIVLRLLPSASIHGQVVATGAEGLRGMRVELLRHAVMDGRPGWQMASARPVAEDGTFSMADLQPGEYTIATREWSPVRLRGNATAASAVTEQYAPDFLGDTRTLEAATKLHLAYGQNAQANLHLQAVPYYPVTIPVQGLPPDAGANVRVSGGAGFQMYQLSWNNRSGVVEGSLPDGDYLVVVNTFGPQHAGAQIPLHVAGAAVVHAPAGLTPTQDIPVSVRDERTQSGSNTGAGNVTVSVSNDASARSTNPGFFLAVRAEDPEAGGGGMMQSTANGPVLRNMMPGRYFLQGNAMGRGYIAAMTCDGVNLLTSALLVNESGRTAPVEVTLRDDSGTISGTVDTARIGTQSARVAVLPSDGTGHVLYGFVTGAGKFQIGNVPPGSYRVFVMPADTNESLPYLDAQMMRAYDGKGAAVTVTAGQTAQVEAEPMGVDGAAVPQ